MQFSLSMSGNAQEVQDKVGDKVREFKSDSHDESTIVRNIGHAINTDLAARLYAAQQEKMGTVLELKDLESVSVSASCSITVS